MAVITMRQMLEAGVHFGHQTRRWNPKMKRFIFGERNGIYIIDLEQTLVRVERAYAYVRDLVAGGGVILFVGTKKQAQDPVRSYAEKCGMPFVNERWLGGMLTNFDTISKRVGKMLEYERMRASGEFDAMPKKEALILSRELEKLQRNLGGLRGMNRKPDAIFVLDTKKEHIAVTEANKLGIPVVAVVDTNVDPELVQYPIPGNDDAIRANSLLARVIADAVEEGRYIAAKRDPGSAPVTRTAEEEAAFAAQQAAARREAAAAQAARERRLETASLRTETPGADAEPVVEVAPAGGVVAEPVAAEVAPPAEVVAEPVATEVAPPAEVVAEPVAEVAPAGGVVAEPSAEVAPAAEVEVDPVAEAALATADEAAADDEAAPVATTSPADAEPAGDAGAVADAGPADAVPVADAAPVATTSPADAEPAGDAGPVADAGPADAAPVAEAAPVATTSPANAEPVADAEPVAGAEPVAAAVPVADAEAAGDAEAGADAGPVVEAAGATAPVAAEASAELAASEFAGGVVAPADGSIPAGFDIKGNVDSMLYHVPGTRAYGATIAEVYFDTIANAEAAGFSAPGTTTEG